jgi:hypothetical protein
MKRQVLYLLLSTALPILAFASSGQPPTGGGFGSSGNVQDALRLNQLLVGNLHSQLQSGVANQGGPTWGVGTFSPGCTSNGTLQLTDLGNNMLGVHATGLAAGRFAALVGGAPSSVAIPFGGGFLCETPFSLMHFFPKQTTALGEFDEAYFLALPAATQQTISFQVMYRVPDQGWFLNLSDAVHGDFVTP